MTRSGRFRATVGRRARLAASLVADPADFCLVLRMAGWRLVLPLMTRRLPLTRLVRMMWRGDQARPVTPECEARIADLARVVYRSEHLSRPGNCLERSLVLYRYLSAAGVDPQLVVGIRSGATGVRGHAWITARGEPVEEPPQSLEGLTQVVSFRGDGSQPQSRRISDAVRAAP